MKKILATVFAVSLIPLSSAVLAERGWIGGTPVKQIFYAQSNGNCGPDNGPCLMLKFEDGYTNCEWVSIKETDPSYKNVQTLALVSLTAGRVLSIYGSIEYCKDANLVSINNVLLN